MGLSSLCLGCRISRQYFWTNQVGTLLTCIDLSWSLTISCRISSSGSKPSNWSWITSILCGVWWWIFHSYKHEGRQNTPKLDISCAAQIIKWCTREYWPQGKLIHSRSWGSSQWNPNARTEGCTKNTKNVIILSQFVQQVQYGQTSKVDPVSKVIEHTVSKVVQNTSKFPKFSFP